MKKIFFLLSALLLANFLSAQKIDSELSGNWQGKGKIIVSWAKNKTLDFNIVIGENGKVTGKIGDAEIGEARLEKRSSLMKALGNGDYIISGKLKGALVENGKIEREGFILMFSLSEGKITGEFHSSGSKFGGKDEMVMTVTDVILQKLE